MDARLGTPWATTYAHGDESPDLPLVYVLMFLWLLLALIVVGASEIEE
jgi:hypothetical protein